MKIQIKLLAFITLALLSVKSYCQSGNSITTTPAITAQSNAFKNLSGQNRLAEFKALQKNIIIYDGGHSQAVAMGFGYSSKSSITNLLGTPDKITEGGFWIYMLKNNPTNCKVVLGFDKTAQVIFCTIKDCD